MNEIKKGQPRNRENQWYNYCKRKGHTKEKCWKLNGRPPQDMNGKFSHAHMVAYPSYAQGGFPDGIQSIPWNPQPIRLSYNFQPPLLPPPTHPPTILIQPRASQDLQQKIDLLQQHVQNLMASSTSSGSSRSIIGSTSLAKTGTPYLLFDLFPSPKKTLQSSWILDSGATDHMTPTYTHVLSYEPCVSDKKVQTADVTLLQVAGIGRIKLEPIGLLTQVLHVPKLFISLVSIQKLAKMREYRIVFDNFDAFLYNKVHRWRIGLARICHVLYHLLITPGTLRQKEKFMVSAVTSVPAKKEATLIHRRLGHPSLTLLKMMYPSLSKNCSIDDLICNACQLAKLKRNTYPLEQNRCREPFQIIHCDI